MGSAGELAALLFFSACPVFRKKRRRPGELIRKAGEGDVDAQFYLAAAFYLGEGLPTDYVRSYAWFDVAAARKHQSAKSLREMVEGLLSPDQIAQGRLLSREISEWIRQESGKDDLCIGSFACAERSGLKNRSCTGLLR